MDKLLWYLIAGTKGGINRARIIKVLKDDPSNANQLSEKLNLDYKTVRHHLKVLKENQVVTIAGNGYGQVNFLSSLIEREYDAFLNIYDKIKHKMEGN